MVLTAGLSVTATMSALALERRSEVALMKAIGAREGVVSVLFFLEAATLGTAGGALGYGLEWGLAQVVGRAMEASSIPATGVVVLATVLSAVVLTIATSILPVRRALGIDPAVTLRGE